MMYDIVESSEEACKAIVHLTNPSTKRVKTTTKVAPHCQFPLDDLLIGQSFYVSKLAWLGGVSSRFVKQRGTATDKVFMVLHHSNQIEIARIG